MLLERQLRKGARKTARTPGDHLCPERFENQTLLSLAQQRLWFPGELLPNSSSYHIVKIVHLNGALRHNFVEARRRVQALTVKWARHANRRAIDDEKKNTCQVADRVRENVNNYRQQGRGDCQ
jgi:hypothetical protein